MNIANFIDYTILKADCTLDDIKRVCSEAAHYQFVAVCIPPYYVHYAAEALSATNVKVATVVGFPMGYSPTPAKVEEIKRAIEDGANEVDVVINLCAVKAGNWNYVRSEIESMVMAAHLRGKIIKVIVETALLTDNELSHLANICLETRPDFVKTSTGFNGEGATIEVVSRLKQLLKGEIKIKASGGIRTRKAALQLIEAGAHRIGSSSGVAMMKEDASF